MNSKRSNPSTYGKLKKAIRDSDDLRKSGTKPLHEQSGMIYNSKQKFYGVNEISNHKTQGFKRKDSKQKTTSHKGIKSKKGSRNAFYQ